MLYDKDIREPLFEFLDIYFGKNRIMEEMQIGRSRADIVMVLPNIIVGIEIKSDADTYARLPGQVKDYDCYFDNNYIVVGSTHATNSKKYVPEYWGIISVEEENGKLDFYIVREAKSNNKVQSKKKLSILWRPELAHIQEINALPQYKQKSKEFVIDKIIEKVPLEHLQQQVSDELFERDYTLIVDRINEFRSENGKKPRRKKSRSKRS